MYQRRFKDNLLLDETDHLIIKNLFEGLSNREIGKRVFMHEKSIKGRLSRIFKVYNVKTRLQLVVKIILNRENENRIKKDRRFNKDEETAKS